MHVDVDEAWSHHETSSIDDECRLRSIESIDRRYAAAHDAHVSSPAQCAGSVDHLATLDENIEVQRLGL